jgi:hypothetical protein
MYTTISVVPALPSENEVVPFTRFTLLHGWLNVEQ